MTKKKKEWTTRGVRDSFGISLWKDIRKGWEDFSVGISIRIGNGRCTRLWWDRWMGEFKLKDVQPTVFEMSSHKDATFVD